VIAALERLWFRFRTRALRRRLDIALEIRRRHRADRQAAAKRAANTRFQHRMEGLTR